LWSYLWVCLRICLLKLGGDSLFARIFWSLNVALAGIIIGRSVFAIQEDFSSDLPKVILAVGISHAVVSIICYKKFVGKGLLSKD
jgi:hypothetical protein